MDKKLLAIIVIIAIIIIGVGAYFLVSDANVVTIGYLPSDHDSALFVADAQNQFEANGINTKLVQFNNGGDLMTAMASGDVDVGYVGITPVLASIEKGVPVKVISAAQTEGSGIVVAKNSGISSAQDLSGKSVATPGEASIQYMLLQYYLKENGLDVSDLKVSSMKVPSMNDALKTSKLDGIITFEPYVSNAMANGGILLEDSAEIIPNHPCCVVVASDEFLNSNTDDAKTILAIHENATDFINEKIANGKTSDVVDLLPEDIVSDKDVEADSINSFPFISGLNESYKQDVLDFMELEVDLGVLKDSISEDKIFWNSN